MAKKTLKKTKKTKPTEHRQQSQNENLPTREKLIEAVHHVVRSQGPANLTLENVAQAAGLSKGGLLYHFPSKDELIRGIVEEYVRKEKDRIKQAVGDDPSIADILSFLIESEMNPNEEEKQNKFNIAAVIIPALIEDPSLLKPLEHHPDEINQKINQLSDPAMGHILMLALNGFHFQESFFKDMFNDRDRKAVIKKMSELARGLK